MNKNFRYISPKLISIPPDAERQRSLLGDIDDLLLSIPAVGILNPIIVHEILGQFTLIAGKRRLTAALELGLPEVPIRLYSSLSKREMKIIELEENVKRSALPWRDNVRSIGEIHQMYLEDKGPDWRIEDTAKAVGMHRTTIYTYLIVYGKLNDKSLINATGIDNAYSILQRHAARKAENIVNNIITGGVQAFKDIEKKHAIVGEVAEISTDLPKTDAIAPNKIEIVPIAMEKPKEVYAQNSVICIDFSSWVSNYTGPKFNLIHCDFPYGTYAGSASSDEFYSNTKNVYFELLEVFCTNLHKIISYSAHVIFWFDMKFYSETYSALQKVGLDVQPHPLLWHKTTGGVAPARQIMAYPLRSYETALICTKGNRPLTKLNFLSYAAPSPQNKIHPSQKPEPMLKYFFQMFVDETTTLLDPTCGSASALRAAEDLGAKSVIGLELDPNHVKSANEAMRTSRLLRASGR